MISEIAFLIIGFIVGYKYSDAIRKKVVDWSKKR